MRTSTPPITTAVATGPAPTAAGLCGFLRAGSGRGTLAFAYSTARSRALCSLPATPPPPPPSPTLPMLPALPPPPLLAGPLPALPIDAADERRCWLVALIWRDSCLMRSLFSRCGAGQGGQMFRD
jgi:hypothetical protein